METTRTRLSRRAIVAAARLVADRDGVGALTVRRVARELDTGPASLYRHIADRADLLGLLSDDLAASFPLVDVDATDPPAGVRAQWARIGDHLDRHPWGVHVIADGTHPTRTAAPVSERCFEHLAAAGLSGPEAERVYAALWRFTLSGRLIRHPFGHLANAEPAEPDLDWLVDRLLPRPR